MTLSNKQWALTRLGLALLLATTCVISLGSNIMARDPSCFQLEGYLIKKQYDTRAPRLAPTQTHRYQFSLVASNTSYVLHSLKVGKLERNEVADMITGSTGSNVFKVNVAPEPFGDISLFNGFYPEPASHHELVIWLAYCAHLLPDVKAAFQKGGDLLNYYGPQEVRLEIAQNQSNPPFISSFKVFSPPYTYDKSSPPARVPLRGAHSEGYLMSEYRVAATKRIDGSSIPTEFSLWNYRLHSQSSTAGSGSSSDGTIQGVSVKSFIHGFVTNITQPELNARLLSATGRVYQTFDYRFADMVGAEGVIYFLTNVVWLPKTDPLVRTALEATKRSGR